MFGCCHCHCRLYLCVAYIRSYCCCCCCCFFIVVFSFRSCVCRFWCRFASSSFIIHLCDVGAALCVHDVTESHANPAVSPVQAGSHIQFVAGATRFYVLCCCLCSPSDWMMLYATVAARLCAHSIYFIVDNDRYDDGDGDVICLWNGPMDSIHRLKT